MFHNDFKRRKLNSKIPKEINELNCISKEQHNHIGGGGGREGELTWAVFSYSLSAIHL